MYAPLNNMITRCLVLLIVITLIFIAGVITTAGSGQYNFIYTFAGAPLLLGALFFSANEAFLLFFVSFIFAAAFIRLNIGMHSLVQTFLYLSVIFISGLVLRRLTDRILRWKERILSVIKEEHRSSYELNKKAQADKLNLEEMVYDISSLYQSPKKMISSSRLEELVDCFSKTLEDYFDFTRAKLIIFSFKDREPSVDKIFNLPDDGARAKAEDGYAEALIGIMKDRKGPLIIDMNSGAPLPKGLVLQEDIGTFLAIRLSAGDKTNGIFVIEGPLADDIIRFIILANQFSMVLERIRLYELVQELAITDGLTGVFVRRHFMERFQEEVERARSFSTRLSFIMVDIDYFKRCNDKYGHLVGDAVLKRTAEILKDNLRDIDIIGRYGGEEFSIMLPETAKKNAVAVSERLCKAVESSYIEVYDEKIKVTISLGITTFPDDASEMSQIIDKADKMLYKAKEEGRNRVKAYA